MGIFAGHAPVLSTLRPGVVAVTNEGGETERIFVRGGFAEVNPQGLDAACRGGDSPGRTRCGGIAQQVKNAEDDVADAKTDARPSARRRKISIT